MGYYSQVHICQCLTRLSTLRAKSIVTLTGNRQKTGQQFVEDVMSLAQGLLHLGLQNGDLVAICAFNSDWYLEWLLAVAFVGGIVAPLNYRWSFEEAKSAMLSVRPVMLVADESCNHWQFVFPSSIIPSLKWHVFLGSSPSGFTKSLNPLATETLRNHARISPVMDPCWAPDSAAIVCFTSGTTGRPKGVTISHSALVVQSLAKVASVGYSEDDVYLHTAPLCHIGGLSSALATLMVGGCHVLIPKFEASLAMDVIEQHYVTSFITVPAMMSDLISLMRTCITWLMQAILYLLCTSKLAQLISERHFTRRKTSWKGSQSVTKILNGGGSLTVELTKDATKIFPRAKILSAYGMTETCSSLTFMTLHDPTLQTPGQSLQISGNTKSISIHPPQGVCVGKPAPHVELKICADVLSHPVGRILTRGPHVMLGYWSQNSEKAFYSTREAWLDTGDIGSIDNNGNVWLVGRVNGRIKSGGENVYPEEVEAILLQHPGVSASVIVGIADARLAEKVVACIKPRETWEWITDSRCRPCDENKQLLSGDILEKHCKEKHLTGFKVPKQFILWSKAFPMTSTGKMRREQVRGEVVSYLQSFSSRL